MGGLRSLTFRMHMYCCSIGATISVCGVFCRMLLYVGTTLIFDLVLLAQLRAIFAAALIILEMARLRDV